MTSSSYHIRSNSLPSRPHPLTSQFDEHLNRLRASEATSTSSSSSSVRYSLNGLQDLYGCVEKLLQLPLNQTALAQEQHIKWFDELLDGSLRLLDVCSTANNALMQIKECEEDLQSFLRRRLWDKNELESEVKKFLTSRKAVKKTIHSTIESLKCIERKRVLSPFSQDKETEDIVKMLRDVEAVTLSIFNSLLSFICGTKSPSKLSGWSLVSKLMHKRKIACEEEETDISEISKVDAALQALLGCKTNKSDNITAVEDVQKELKNLDLCIQDLEDGLEPLYSILIKSRVSILNILK